MKKKNTACAVITSNDTLLTGFVQVLKVLEFCCGIFQDWKVPENESFFGSQNKLGLRKFPQNAIGCVE